jgi:hypothetical protein
MNKAVKRTSEYVISYEVFEKTPDVMKHMVPDISPYYEGMIIYFDIDKFTDEYLEDHPNEYENLEFKTEYIKNKWGHLGDYGFFDVSNQ